MEKKIDFEGEWSNEYDVAAEKIIPAYSTIYELTHHLLRSLLPQEARLLVAGSGTGKEIIDYSRHNPSWAFTGFDPAERMIEIAKGKISESNIENKIDFVSGQIDDVPENDFDAATSLLVMQFLPDDGEKLRFLKNIAERLRAGGPIVLVDLEGEIGSDKYTTLDAAWKNQQLFSRAEGKKIAEEFEIREREVHFITQNRIESLLQEAGFSNIYKFFQAYLFGGYVAIKK